MAKTQLRKVAEICIVAEQPLRVAARQLDLSDQQVGAIKNTHECWKAAIEIQYNKTKKTMQRRGVTRAVIRQAVAMFTNRAMTTTEIDEALSLKPGTTKLLTAHKLWRTEKLRQLQFGEEAEEEDAK